jgi:putative membrane protein
VKNYIRLFLTGFGMGSADIVPGVSGGTIAFIFGVYEELVFSIKRLSGETIKLFLKGKYKDAINSIPFSFLIPLGVGIVTAFLTLAKLITYLLANQPVFVWSFFFGLIVASILIVRKRVVTWDRHDIAVFVVAAVGAYMLTGSVPVETPATSIAFFISGFVAIIAMILPGISGSFLLVLMGKYEQVLHAVVERDILTLGLVMAGAVVGLAIFSRVLTWLFEKHHDIAVATLTGFMAGSLRKVWPWKEAITTRINSKGLEVPVIEKNIFPNIDTTLVIALFLMVIAAWFLMYLEKKHATAEQTTDIDKKYAKGHKKAVASQKSGKI